MGNHDELLRKRQAREEGRDPYAAPPELHEHEAKLVEIKQRAEHVQSAHNAKREAIMNERQNASEILRRAVAFGMPAIEALVGKIETCNEKVSSLRAGGGLSVQQVREEHFLLKGVLLVDRFNAVQHDRDMNGTYGGVGLYLLEDGALSLGRRSGTWSRRLGETSEFRLTMEPVSCGEALRHFRIEQILEGLLEALTAQGALTEQSIAVQTKAQKLVAGLAILNEFLAQ